MTDCAHPTLGLVGLASSVGLLGMPAGDMEPVYLSPISRASTWITTPYVAN